MVFYNFQYLWEETLISSHIVEQETAAIPIPGQSPLYIYNCGREKAETFRNNKQYNFIDPMTKK